MLWKCCTQYANKFGKLSSGHKTEKGQFSFQSQRKAMPKECSNYGIIALISHTSKVSSVQLSHSAMSDSLWPHGLQYARLACPSWTSRAYSNSCPLSQWCHPTISSSVIPFSSLLQSFPASGSFQMSQFFASGGQSNAQNSPTQSSTVREPWTSRCSSWI